MLNADLQTVLTLTAVFVAWSGLMLGMIKLLLIRVSKDIDDRLDSIILSQQSDSQEWRRVERGLMELRAELPIQYQRREDAIRDTTVILARIESLGSHIDGLVKREDHIRSETLLHTKMDGLADYITRKLEGKTR